MMLEVDVRHGARRARGPGFTLEAAFTQAGGVTALYGPSGAGKTTLILAIAGLAPRAQGRIALNGRALLDSAAGVRVPARRRRIGVVFQDGRLFPHLSVRSNLLYGARRAGGRAPDAAQVDHVVRLLGLGALLARRPLGLSGGERQRVALGRALLSAPDLLLLDEPLAALDTARKAEILPYLEQVRDAAGVPILYVSHAVDEIARLADRVVALENGRVVAQGPVEAVFAGLGLRDAVGDAVALLSGTLGAPAADGLSDLTLDGMADGRLSLEAPGAAPGARLRVQVRARDVMIALDPPARVSANNVLPVTIGEVAPRGANVLLLLDCGGQALTAQVTMRAATRLNLTPGTPAYAVVKSVTIAR